MSRLIQKEWMSEKDRFSRFYKEGVQYFVEFAKANNHDCLTTCPCPCQKCKNGQRVMFEDELRMHLLVNGMDPTYRLWVFHGEKPYDTPLVEHIVEENTDNAMFRMGDFVDASYGVHEELGSDSLYGNDFEEPYVPEPDLPKRYHTYKEKAKEKLYPSCEGSETTLSAVVELHDLKKRFGWSGTSVTALLKVLKKWLPKGNTLPNKYPIMKEMLNDLGMKARRIDACENDCILYWKENENLTECPKCKAHRYNVKVGKIGKRELKEPKKVLRHFPLIPRLKRLYTVPWIAQEMTWHHRATPSSKYMRHPIDSVQWKSCKSKWPDFAEEGRNIWLAIATDGFNPRGIQSTGYSCWPVILVPYNLPPSLCMKSEFHMMSLLIPGPKAPSQDIDVFMQPLFDELKQLWEGVPAFDMKNQEHFTLRAMLMWGIHDFPAYGNLSGCVTHGYKACPVCTDDTPSISLSTKIVYMNFRMFLKMGHPYRDNKRLGFKNIEERVAPQRLNGPVLLQKLSHVKYVPGKTPKGQKRIRVDVSEAGCSRDGADNASPKKAWYRRSILFDLEYWIHHKVRHVIDVMHVEKNVAEHLLNAILDKKDKTKDTSRARDEMEKMGIHPNMWMTTNKVTGKPEKPVAAFVLGKEEKKQVLQRLKELKLPSEFSSNLSNIVSSDHSGLLVMKSHDYHVIIEHLLPVLLQHAFPKHRDLRRALHQISLFFNLLCSKVLIREEIQVAKYMVVEALCVMEKYFPPSFFDISIHLMVHLADEALLCGPVPQRWMYPFERAMKDCKNIPSNKRYVEGSIAEAYLISESVRYAMEYMPKELDGNENSSRDKFLDEDGVYGDQGGPLLDGKVLTLSPEQFTQIRRWVLFRLDDVPLLDEYYSEYRMLSQSTTRGKGKEVVKPEVETQTEFIGWLYKKLLNLGDTSGMLWQLVKGPSFEAKSYKKYRINGFVFSPKSHDDTVNTQNSGVCMKAITTFTASRKDKNPVDAEIMWYGFIKEILEVDYSDFQTVVFYCQWVKVEDKTNGCKLCPDSNLVMVKLSNLKRSDKSSNEPAILASEASQVFYSRDLKNPDWWVVIHSPRGLTARVDQLEEPEVFQSTLADQPNLKQLMITK